MATLIARLPSIRRTDHDSHDGGGQHHRLQSPPPSPLLEEADLATLDMDDSQALEDKKKKKKKKKHRSKGKEVDPSERTGGNDGDSVVHAQEEEEEADATQRDSYPPVNDEEAESKKIQETLKHWDMMEKQRRKAARDSRTARTPSTILSDVAGYVSTFGGGGARPLSPARAGWVEANARDSTELDSVDRKPTSPPLEPDVDLTSPTTPTAKKPKPKHKSRLSQASIVTTDSGATATSGPQNPFSNTVVEEEDDTTTTPTRSRHIKDSSISSSTSSQNDPFQNASPQLGVDAAKNPEQDVPLLASPTPGRSMTLLQVPPPTTRRRSRSRSSKTPPEATDTSSSRKDKRSSTAPVRPLDLPEPRMPRMEPDPESGHWRRAHDARQRQADLEEEMEGDKARGRWWTDLFCGCRESNRREDQDGRTNPFE